MRKVYRSLLISAARVLLLLALVLGVLGVLFRQPTWRRGRPSSVRVDPGRLRAHVEKLSRDFHPRSFDFETNIAACVDHLHAAFAAAGGRVTRQPYRVLNREWSNVSALWGPAGRPRIVVGAHYDTYSDTPGADDNASGVAGLIELAALFGRAPPAGEVELVAYGTEEPPFFRTPEMGSFNHAKALKAAGVPVRGVIALEMIGFFRDERGSQKYPMMMLRLFYPARANFIAVAGDGPRDWSWTRAVKGCMQGVTDLPVYSINAPVLVPGIDFSDHRNYWPHGWPAVMVTDTAFYRHPHYHGENDTADRLDYRRMADVVAAVYEAVQTLSREEK